MQKWGAGEINTMSPKVVTATCKKTCCNFLAQKNDFYMRSFFLLSSWTILLLTNFKGHANLPQRRCAHLSKIQTICRRRALLGQLLPMRLPRRMANQAILARYRCQLLHCLRLIALLQNGEVATALVPVRHVLWHP